MPQDKRSDGVGFTPASTQLQLARKRFFEDGADPDGLVPELIARSWRRCATISADLAETPEPLPQAELLSRRDAHGRLRRYALPELEALAEALSPSRLIVVLADPQGMILDAAGSEVFMNKAQRVAVMPGVDWSELHRGTNAIGTALTEVSPVTVLGPQHYLEQNGILGCTAAPLLSPDGQVMGVLDVTGGPRCIQAQTIGLLHMAAQMIEHRMALDSLPSQTAILRFAHDTALIGSHREALLWIRNDIIVGANRAALRLLGMTFEQLQGRFVDDLFSTVPGKEREQSWLSLQPWLARPGQSTSWTSEWVGRKSAVNGIASPIDPEYPSAIPERLQAAESDEKTWVRPAFSHEAIPSRLPIIGDSRRDAQLDRAVRVTDSGIPVLILGESGVGKEVFARQIHERSQRHRGPFIAVNCAAVPEGLIEAELFGYEEGAFTGARRKGQPGLIREANGGILFLDEIGDMPLSLQARLLRVLQDHEVKPLGGGRQQPVDFALVCATHRDLKAMSAEGKFRSDLFYRLQHFTVHLPALRDQSDGQARIGELLQTMLSSRNIRLSPQARAALLSYSWPGNWRQLVAVMQTLLALAEPQSCIELADLPDDIRGAWRDRQQQRQPALITSGPERNGAVELSLPLTELRALTESAIQTAISSCRGNISHAARLLGVHRSTLYRHVLQNRQKNG